MFIFFDYNESLNKNKSSNSKPSILRGKKISKIFVWKNLNGQIRVEVLVRLESGDVDNWAKLAGMKVGEIPHEKQSDFRGIK